MRFLLSLGRLAFLLPAAATATLALAACSSTVADTPTTACASCHDTLDPLAGFFSALVP